eukprot:NODE_363_length_10100_cov_0.133787.p1 type:complete len:1064 gc:universal NODE_363_length_10100_cov_0.133787:4322-7513(+)
MSFGYINDTSLTTLSINFSPISNGFALVYGVNALIKVEKPQNSFSDFIKLDSPGQVISQFSPSGSVTWLTVCSPGYYPKDGIFPASSCLPCPNYSSSSMLMKSCECLEGYYSLLDASSSAYYSDIISNKQQCVSCRPGTSCSHGIGSVNDNVLQLKSDNVLCESGCQNGICTFPYKGDFCSECAAEHYKFNRTCLNCDNSGLYLAILFLCLLFSPLVLYFIFKAWKKMLTVSIGLFFIQELALVLYTDVLFSNFQSQLRYLGLVMFDVGWSKLECFSNSQITFIFPMFILPLVYFFELFWKMSFFGISKTAKRNHELKKIISYSQPRSLLILMEILYFPILVGLARLGTCKSFSTGGFVWQCPNFATALLLFLGFGIMVPCIHILARIYLKNRKEKLKMIKANESKNVKQTVAWPRNTTSSTFVGKYKTSSNHPLILSFQYLKRFAIAAFWFGSSSWGPITQLWSVAMIEAFAALWLTVCFTSVYRGKMGKIAMFLQACTLTIASSFYLTTSIQPPLYAPLVDQDALQYEMMPFLVGSVFSVLFLILFEHFYVYFNKSDPALYRKPIKPNHSKIMEIVDKRDKVGMQSDLQKFVQVKIDEDGNKKNVVYLTRRALQTMQRGVQDDDEDSEELLPENEVKPHLQGNIIVAVAHTEVEKKDTLLRMIQKMDVRDEPALNPEDGDKRESRETPYSSTGLRVSKIPTQDEETNKDNVRVSKLSGDDSLVPDKNNNHNKYMQKDESEKGLMHSQELSESRLDQLKSSNKSRSNSMERKTSFFSKFTKSKDEESDRIGKPTNFKHTGHLGASNIMLDSLPDAYKEIIEKAGVSSEDLKDPETFRFIIEFIVKKSSGTVKRVVTANENGKKQLYIEPSIDNSLNSENSLIAVNIISPTLIRNDQEQAQIEAADNAKQSKELQSKDSLQGLINEVSVDIQSSQVQNESSKDLPDLALTHSESPIQENIALTHSESPIQENIALTHSESSIQENIAVPPPPPAPLLNTVNLKSNESRSSDMLSSIQNIQLKSASSINKLPIPRNLLLEQIKSGAKLKSVLFINVEPHCAYTK